MWKIGKDIVPDHPNGYARQIEPAYGSFFWTTQDGVVIVDGNGHKIWDTARCWMLLGTQQVEEEEEDIYGA